MSHGAPAHFRDTDARYSWGMRARQEYRRRPLRTILKYGVIASAVGAVGSALAAAPAITVDHLERRGRVKRDAPQPGTFEADVAESSIRIYTDGGALYDDMIAAIDAAEHSVIMETYIWKNDEVGQRFIDAFNHAAERGVRVHLMYDGFANLVVPQSFYRQLSDRVFVHRLPVFRRKIWKAPLRYTGLNHSKVLVVDDRIGFVGGYNIGALYAREWRDTHIREIGPAVWGLRNSVARVWNERCNTDEAIPWIAPDTWASPVHVAANLPVQLVYPIRQMYLDAIERAQHRVWITTPYFVPDQQIVRALSLAAERGVDVRLMVPKESNHILADWVTRGFYGQLLSSKITLLLYAASMIHAKTATIDGEWSTVGTANIDRLSLTFNYETNVEIVDPDFAREMERIYAADSEHCEVLEPPHWEGRSTATKVAEAALLPFRPLF